MMRVSHSGIGVLTSISRIKRPGAHHRPAVPDSSLVDSVSRTSSSTAQLRMGAIINFSFYIQLA
jgi:hypothetical protein